jgi:hypothetical protein
MGNRKTSFLLVLLGAFAFMAVLVGGYTAAYLGLSQATQQTIERPELMDGRIVIVREDRFMRIFRYRWQVAVFQPGALVESRFRRFEIELGTADDFGIEF